MTKTKAPAPVLNNKKVRSFLGAVGGVYLLLAIIWWSGIGAVRTNVSVASALDHPVTSERSATLTLSNNAPTAVTVQEIEVIDGRFGKIRSATTRIGGYETEQVRITYEVDCERNRPFPNAPVLVAHLRTIAGFDRRAYLEGANALDC